MVSLSGLRHIVVGWYKRAGYGGLAAFGRAEGRAFFGALWAIGLMRMGASSRHFCGGPVGGLRGRNVRASNPSAQGAFGGRGLSYDGDTHSVF